MGQFGLWDPWEMNRANIARQMTDAQKVLVVEDTSDGHPLGPIGSWLALRYGDHLQITSLDLGDARHARSARKLLDTAARKLDQGIHHLLIVNLKTVVKDPQDRSQVEQLATWFDGVATKNPGMAKLFAAPLPKRDDKKILSLEQYTDTFKKTWSEVRIQLSAKELGGTSWGKPGPFRKALIRTLKRAGPHTPIKDYTEDETHRSFLEQGFWRAAKKRQLVANLSREITPETVELLASDPLFAFQESIVWWPQTADFEALNNDFRTGDESARQEARDAAASLEAIVDHQTPSPWDRAQFKRGGQSFGVAPFDYWLTARAFEHFGFSEFVVRLPAFLLGLMTILLVYLLCLRLFGPAVATFAAIVLITCPLFFAQGRSAAGQLSSTLALTAGAGGLLLLTQRQALSWISALLLLAGAVLAFFSQGLAGLLTLTAVVVAHTAVSRPERRVLWVPVVSLVALLTGSWILVSTSDAGSFWSSFVLKSPLFGWSITEAERPVVLNFDLLLRQIGFGLAPWIAMAPFALGYLFSNADPERRKLTLLVLIWFIVPYLVHSLLIKDSGHFVYPAAPAFAVATGLLLVHLAEGRTLGFVAGIIGATIVLLLLSNINKSPEPLTAFLTVDPPTFGDKGSVDYPEALKVPVLLKLALMAAAALMLLGPARLASRARKIVTFMARPVPFWTTVALVALSLTTFLLMGLESQIAQGLSTHTGRLLEPVHRVFVRSVFYWRPEVWALAVFVVGGALSLLIHHTRWFPWLKNWFGRWLVTPFWAYLSGLLALFGALAVSVQSQLDPWDGVSIPIMVLSALVLVGPWIVVRSLRPRLSHWATNWSPLTGLSHPFSGVMTVTVSLTWSLWFLTTQVGADSVEVSVLMWVGMTLSSLPLGFALSRDPGRYTQIITMIVLAGTVGELLVFGHSSSLALPATIAFVLLFGAHSAHRIPINAVRWVISRIPGIGHLQRDSRAFVATHLLLGFACLGAALTCILLWGAFSDGYVAFATWESPLGYLGVLLLVSSIALIRYGRTKAWAFTQSEFIVRGVPLAIAAWILAGFCVQLLYGSGLSLADFMSSKHSDPAAAYLMRTRGLIANALIFVSSLVCLNLVWGRIKVAPGRAFAFLICAGVTLVIIMVAALSRKWMQLQPAVQSADTEPYLSYLFYGSRRVLLFYAMLGGLLILAVGAWLRRTISHESRLWKILRGFELFERPRVFVTAIAAVIAIFAFLYNQQLVKALSFHVSQKHLLESVQKAEQDGAASDRIYQHGVGGRSSNNFYTQSVPEVKDAKAALAALASQEDTVLSLTEAGRNLPVYRVARAFSEANDLDQDGRRDWEADTGIAEKASPAEGWLEDPNKSWTADQWQGFLLIDSDGWRFPVIRNSAKRVYYDKSKATPPSTTKGRATPRNSPAFDTRPTARNRYRLDSKDAQDHKATAMISKRVYFLLPKVGQSSPSYTDRGSFSELNFQYRKASKGRHLKVLDDRSSRILLATSRLMDGEADHNWLAKATLTKATFIEMVKAGKVRGVDPKSPLNGMIDWEGKIKLLGWSMDDRTVSRGKKFRLHLYFEAVKSVRSSYKIFAHMDRSGHRIHGDHWPLAVSRGKAGKHCIGCFQSDHWIPGDIIVDSYEREVPLGAPSGETDINLGLFNPQNDKRLKIKRWDQRRVRYGGNDNRARIGSFIVR